MNKLQVIEELKDFKGYFDIIEVALEINKYTILLSVIVLYKIHKKN